jgi:hypothetical protein
VTGNRALAVRYDTDGNSSTSRGEAEPAVGVVDAYEIAKTKRVEAETVPHPCVEQFDIEIGPTNRVLSTTETDYSGRHYVGDANLQRAASLGRVPAPQHPRRAIRRNPA